MTRTRIGSLILVIAAIATASFSVGYRTGVTRGVADCATVRSIPADLAARITSPEEWFANQAEIIYVALRGEKSEVDQLFALVPMATKGDCTCFAGAPGDAAAIVVTREFELDTKLAILDAMDREDRQLAFRYLSAVSPLDWNPEEVQKAHDIADE
jgi:hypothetical protein